MQSFKIFGQRAKIRKLGYMRNVLYDCSRFFLVLFLSALHDPEYCPNPEGLNFREERCKDTTSRMGIVTAHERAHTVAKSKFLSKNAVAHKSTPTLYLNFCAKNEMIYKLIL